MTSHSCLSSSPCTILLILLVSLSGCRPCHLHTGPQASSILAGCLLSPHNTFSFASHFQFDPSQGPTDLSPRSHISHFFSTVSCHCLFFPWMAQKGWRTEENRQAGRQDCKHGIQQGRCREAISTSQCLPFTCTAQTRPFLFSPTHKELSIVTSSLLLPHIQI